MNVAGMEWLEASWHSALIDLVCMEFHGIEDGGELAFSHKTDGAHGDGNRNAVHIVRSVRFWMPEG